MQPNYSSIVGNSCQVGNWFELISFELGTMVRLNFPSEFNKNNLTNTFSCVKFAFNQKKL